jgi:peptidoglycan/LPS O-acetylase OafA/YrhL
MSETGTAARRWEDGSRSLGDALRGHTNSLGLIRLVLAALVIFDHGVPLGGYGVDHVLQLTRQQASLGSLAVAGFFAISGYLIAKSGMNADVLQFLWRRVLRIFPAYWAVLIFTAVVVGPIAWVLEGNSFGTYFSLASDGPVGYFLANWRLRIGAYGIYDIFQHTTPYGHLSGAPVFNGSIWTLIYEFTCYLLIAVLVAFGVLLRARILVPVLTGALFAVQLASFVNPEALGAVFPFFADSHMINLMLTFLFGSCLAVYSRSVPFDDRLGILSLLVLLVSLRTGGFAIVGLPAGAYLVLYLGARIGGRARLVGAKNDYSYGVYVWGFLVEQCLAFAGVWRWGYAAFTIIALAISLGFAWLSWHGVEKHAMALKDWGPGRGWHHWYDRVRSLRAPRRDPAALAAAGPEAAPTAAEPVTESVGEPAAEPVPAERTAPGDVRA